MPVCSLCEMNHFDNQPLATPSFWDLSFSHSDASILRKSRNRHEAVVYPWECWSEFLVAGCLSGLNFFIFLV